MLHPNKAQQSENPQQLMPSEKFRYLSPNNNRKKKHISTSKWCFIEPQAATCIPTILAILVRHIRSLPSKTWTSKPIRLFDVEGGCASCLIHVRLQRPTYRKYWRQSACLPILANQNVKRGGNLLLVNYSCHAQDRIAVNKRRLTTRLCRTSAVIGHQLFPAAQ